MAFSGSVSRGLSANRSESGQTSLDGSLGDSYSTKRSLSGSVSFAGEIISTLPGYVSRTIEGVLSFAGLLSDDYTFSRSVSGILRFAGIVSSALNGGGSGATIQWLLGICHMGLRKTLGIFNGGFKRNE